jgi:YhcH/YjgK/YiaL family protein
MIIDKIENSHLYKGLSKRIEKAFEYIGETDLKNIQPGKYEIDGENIFALISEYKTKSEAEEKIEAHKSILMFSMLSAVKRRMGYAPLNGQKFSNHTKKMILCFSPEKKLSQKFQKVCLLFFFRKMSICRE